MSSTGDTWRLGHRPALDGLRGVAVLLVVASHLNVPLFQGGGQVGVTMFFTVSGFLISTLLLEELEGAGRVSLRGFYERRARRLLPALVVMVAMALALGSLGVLPMTTKLQVFGALFYCSNILHAFGLPAPGGMVMHTWTLVIEEQFYLVWPVLLLALARYRRVLLAALVVAGVGSGIWRTVLWAHGESFGRYIAGTDARLDGIILGCALAVLLRGRRAMRAPSWLILAGLGICWAFCAVVWKPLWVPGLTVVAFATAAVIWAIVAGETDALLNARWLVAVGKRCYGVYIWHLLVLVAGEYALGLESRLALIAWTVPVSIVVVELSWRYVESPFRRLGCSPRCSVRDEDLRHISVAASVVALTADQPIRTTRR